MSNLRMIQIAKQMYADDYKLTNDVAFSKEQLLPYLGGKWPQCPKGGQYFIGILEDFEDKWEGVYVIAYRDGAPSEIFFTGHSGD